MVIYLWYLQTDVYVYYDIDLTFICRCFRQKYFNWRKFRERNFHDFGHKHKKAMQQRFCVLTDQVAFLLNERKVEKSFPHIDDTGLIFLGCMRLTLERYGSIFLSFKGNLTAQR